MTQRVYVDRSRYETAQSCARRRWLEYHEGGRGITSARKPLPLAVGGAVHEGLAWLLREGQKHWDRKGGAWAAGDTNWDAIENEAVDAALADFAQFDGGRIALEPTEAPPQPDSLESAYPRPDAPVVTDYDRYLYAEQSALVEAIVRAYARRRLRPLLEQFTVLEVEREGEWELATYGGSRWSPNLCQRCQVGVDNDGDGNCGFCAKVSDEDAAVMRAGREATEIVFMSRPDALLLEKSSGQLYLQSFKTTSGWDVRRARDAEHDMQGLSEGVEVERRLADWWRMARSEDELPAMSSGERLELVRRYGSMTPRMYDWLADLPAPPRILGIRYEYLLKGERWKDKDLAARFGFDARAQRSPLVRGYLNAGMAAGDEQWNVAWDYLKDGGTGETSKLNYRAWKSAPVWESMPIAQWVTMLDESAMAVSGDTGGELGYKSAAQATGYLAQHPLDEVFLAPIVIYRNDDDLRDMVEQMEAAERRTAEGVAVVTAASDEGERRSLLNRHFPQTRRACSWPTECPYVKICYGGEDIRRDPMASGLYRIRVPNHPVEGTGR